MTAEKITPMVGFPLQWPEGWKRTAELQRTRSRYKITPDKAKTDLLKSLVLLGADRRSIVISSNLPLKKDGTPYLSTKDPEDCGVAVYWTTTKFGERVIACDRWTMVYENLHAIGLALEGLRAMERAGATQILERAFTAFGALPPAPEAPKTRPWWEVFGFPEEAKKWMTLAMATARYRELATAAHPDKPGGSMQSMAELNAALEEAKVHFGG